MILPLNILDTMKICKPSVEQAKGPNLVSLEISPNFLVPGVSWLRLEEFSNFFARYAN